MSNFVEGIFFITLGILFVVFPKRWAESVLAFWYGKRYTESHKRFGQILVLVVGIIFTAGGVLMLLMPSLFD